MAGVFGGAVLRLAIVAAAVCASLSAAAQPAASETGTAKAPAGAAEENFEIRGTVIATLPRAGRLLVDQQAIPGGMAAMEMGYPVKPLTLLDGLHRGDEIAFTLDETDTITHIRVIKAGP